MKTDIFFNKERGIKGCISDGWRIFALNWRAYIKALWAYRFSQAWLVHFS